MNAPAAGPGLTGTIVAAAIAAAGTTAWVASRQPPPDRAGVDASVPVDASRLDAGAEPVALEQGRVYYVQLCQSCHGPRGDGGGEWAYRVTPRPAKLTSAKTRARSDAQLFDFISEPQPGTPMIGWKKQLSESQRRQLVAYVRYLGSVGAMESRH